MRRAGVFLLLPAIALLAGCSWFKSDPKPGEPNELVDFDATVKVGKLWSVGVGNGVKRGAQQLRPAYREGTLYAADHEGMLLAVDAASGDRLWKLETELPFSGGPGTSEELALVGTQDGEVHAFLRDTGTPAWIARVSSEVLAAPVEAEGIVVVRCIDGRTFGLDARNGRRAWVYDRSVPLLTLRGNSVPVIRAGTVYLGYDGGQLVALRLDDGSLVWEQDVATSEGRTELDRLADIDGQLVFVASDLLVSSFKQKLVSVAADSGRLLWFKDVASASGVNVDRTNMALTDPASHVWLVDRRNGSTLWKQDLLENRGVTRPAIYGNFVVAGDDEGYLHWMNLDDGEFAARVKAGGKGFTDGPLVVGDMLVVQTRKGELIAYRAGGER